MVSRSMVRVGAVGLVAAVSAPLAVTSAQAAPVSSNALVSDTVVNRAFVTAASATMKGLDAYGGSVTREVRTSREMSRSVSGQTAAGWWAAGDAIGTGDLPGADWGHSVTAGSLTHYSYINATDKAQINLNHPTGRAQFRLVTTSNSTVRNVWLRPSFQVVLATHSRWLSCATGWTVQSEVSITSTSPRVDYRCSDGQRVVIRNGLLQYARVAQDSGHVTVTPSVGEVQVKSPIPVPTVRNTITAAQYVDARSVAHAVKVATTRFPAVSAKTLAAKLPAWVFPTRSQVTVDATAYFTNPVVVKKTAKRTVRISSGSITANYTTVR